MRFTLIIIPCFMLIACSKPLTERQAPPFLSAVSKARNVLQADINPSIDQALLALNSIAIDTNNSGFHLTTLFECSEKNVFSTEVKAICLIGTSFFNLDQLEPEARKSMTARLLAHFSKEDNLIKTAIAWSLAKNPTWDFSMISINAKAELLTLLNKDGELALRKNFALSGAHGKPSDARATAVAVISDASSAPFSLFNAFFLLYHGDPLEFEKSIERFCSPRSHALLSSRCWRLLAILLQGGFKKSELLPLTNRTGGNWLLSLSGQQWDDFLQTESIYAKILINAQ